MGDGVDGDPYEVLGIPRSATLGQAEEAYRRRLRDVHPDHHAWDDDIGRAAAGAETQALNAAIRSLRYELREVRAVDRCASCGAPAVDVDRPCPVCGHDPTTVPWWREAAGESAPGSLPPVAGLSGSTDWMTTPRGGNAAGPAIVALLALAGFAVVFWLITRLASL